MWRDGRGGGLSRRSGRRRKDLRVEKRRERGKERKGFGSSLGEKCTLPHSLNRVTSRLGLWGRGGWSWGEGGGAGEVGGGGGCRGVE